MAINSCLMDGEGTRRAAGVTSRNALKVSVVDTVATELPIETLTARKVFKGYLTNSAQSKEMNVNGSATAVIFKQVAEEGRVLWITSLRLVFYGTSLEMSTNDFRRFGAATSANSALPNGVTLSISQGGIVTEVFPEPVTRMGDFFTFADRDKNIINALTTQSDFLYFDFDFDSPVVLPAGSADFIAVTVRDDLTPLDLFRGATRGYQELAT